MSGQYVFLNCPFSDDYSEKFAAMVFTIVRCGFEPRCALEDDDSTVVRFSKIVGIIRDCRLSVHDISITELDEKNNLPRFNMPFELGLFLGAKEFGRKSLKPRQALILDRERYRFQKFISDIAGQDIQTHDGETQRLILVLAKWLQTKGAAMGAPGGRKIAKEFVAFMAALPEIAAARDLEAQDLTFMDLKFAASEWAVTP